jgi:hypothetical protein
MEEELSVDSCFNSSAARAPRIGVLLVVLALISSACASSPSSGDGGTTGKAEVPDLSRVSELQQRFNQDSGNVRLILLFSPT